MVTNEQSVAPKRSWKSFFSETKNIAGIATGIGIAILVRAVFILATKFCKIKTETLMSEVMSVYLTNL